jgi:hypothetical protein
MTEDDSGLDNSGKPRKEYADRLKKLSDQALEGEAGLKIWLSALADNNPRSDYHWQCDACFDEAERRLKPEIYDRAWDEAAGSLKPQKKALPRNILDTRTGTRLPIILMKSAAGFYLGTRTGKGEPYSRESEEYFGTRHGAEQALARGTWTARRHRTPPPIEFIDVPVGSHQTKGRRR